MLKSLEKQLQLAQEEFNQVTEEVNKIAEPYQQQIDEIQQQIQPSIDKINQLRSEAEIQINPLLTKREQIRGKYTAFFNMYVATKTGKSIEDITEEDIKAVSDEANEGQVEESAPVEEPMVNEAEEIIDTPTAETASDDKENSETGYTLTPEEIAKLQESMKVETKKPVKKQEDDIPEYLK